MTLLSVRQLSKQYGEYTAVDGLSFSVEKGDIYGFLGPNGAGKSTTIRMLLGLITPSSGTITLFGKNLFSEKSYCLARIGAIVEKPDF
ncbi:MAG: ATP-binding cassette domain-containing protein, partial [Bacteroidota bacterium]